MRLCYGWLVAFLVACSSGPTSSGGNPAGGGPTVATVSMNDSAGLAHYAFSPSTITIQAGTVVRWLNAGRVAHSSMSDTPAWDSGSVPAAGSGNSCDPYVDPYCTPGNTPAGSYSRTFSTPGTYQYHCTFHSAQGMTGTITVTP